MGGREIGLICGKVRRTGLFLIGLRIANLYLGKAMMLAIKQNNSSLFLIASLLNSALNLRLAIFQCGIDGHLTGQDPGDILTH